MTLGSTLGSALAMALLGLALAGCCEEVRELSLGVDARLVAMVKYDQGSLAVGEGGVIVHWSPPRSFTPTSVDLHAVTLVHRDELLAVGDEGTVLRYDGLGWSPVIGPDATGDLWAVFASGSDDDRTVVIVGDETLLIRDGMNQWLVPPAPEGGWGQLRTVAWYWGKFYAFGLGGVAWSTTEPTGDWIREDLGVEIDALASAVQRCGDDQCLDVVGRQGAARRYDNDRWMAIDIPTRSDLVAVGGGLVLGANGELFEVWRGPFGDLQVDLDGRFTTFLGHTDGTGVFVSLLREDAVIVKISADFCGLPE
jgi:hypothetical protein